MVTLAIPNLNQLEPTPADNNDANDCGPTSIADVAQYLGIIEPIRQIKADETGDPNYIGFTDVTEMADWFMNRGIPATAVQVNDVPGFISSSLNQGFPCIYLRWSDVNAQTGGHFVVPVSFDPTHDSFGINNPWGAVVDWWTAQQVQDNSKYGWVVQVQRVQLDFLGLTNQQWRSRKTDVAFNVNAALYKEWVNQRNAGNKLLGVPVSDEFTYNNATYQIFTGAIGSWDAKNGVQWDKNMDINLLNMQWRSRKADVAINPNSAIYKSWIAQRQSGNMSLGAPATEEFAYDGGIAQIFTGAVAVWYQNQEVKWL